MPRTYYSAGVTAFADTAYRGLGLGLGLGMRAPFRKVCYDRATRKFTVQKLSDNQRAVNRSISTMPGPGERANAELKNWRILRKIRTSPAHAGLLVNAVQAVIINS